MSSVLAADVMSVVETEHVCSMETRQTFAVEIGQMSASETRPVFFAETRHMQNSEKGQRLVLRKDTCLGSAEDV